MEYTKRVGRTTFRADVTHNKRGDWSIRANAFQATLPMTGPEADAWAEAGMPADPMAIPARIEAFLGKVASSKPKGVPAPKREKHNRDAFVQLDGEERVVVTPIDYRSVRFTDPNRVTTGIVRCTSPRCTDTNEHGWFVVQLPGSRHDRADVLGVRVEGITPEEFAEQHRAWHRETNPAGCSARIALSKWIDRHANVQIPELSEAERLEIDLGIALAKSER
jgi:hypothetical protein